MRRAGIACLALLIAACASGPDYQRPSMAWPAAYRGADGAAGAVDPSDTRWWKSFNDPALDALVDDALAGNHDLRQAVLRLQEYEARLQVAGAERYPTLQAAAGASRERMSERLAVPLPLGVAPTNDRFAVGLQARWEIDLWGKLRRADEAATADLLAAEESRRAVVLKLVGDLTEGYARLLRLDAQRDQLLALRRLRQEHVALLEQMREIGSVTDFAVESARAAVAELEGEIAQRERAIAETENALNLLAARPPGPVDRQRGLNDVALPAVPAGLPSALLERRPDLRRAEQELIAANARIGVAKAQFLPAISLTGALGAASASLSNLSLRSANTGSVGVGLLATLFDFGRTEGEVKVAESRQRQLAEAYAGAAAQALREVDDALAARRRSAEREGADERRLQALANALAVVRVRLDGGAATQLELIEADAELQAARITRAESRYEGIAASIALYKALGGGWIDLAAPPAQTAATP